MHTPDRRPIPARRWTHRAPANPAALAYLAARIAVAERLGLAHVWRLVAWRNEMEGRVTRQQKAARRLRPASGTAGVGGPQV